MSQLACLPLCFSIITLKSIKIQLINDLSLNLTNDSSYHKVRPTQDALYITFSSVAFALCYTRILTNNLLINALSVIQRHYSSQHNIAWPTFDALYYESIPSCFFTASPLVRENTINSLPINNLLFIQTHDSPQHRIPQFALILFYCKSVSDYPSLLSRYLSPVTLPDTYYFVGA